MKIAGLKWPLFLLELKKVVHTKYEVLSNMGKKQPKICKDRISEKDLP